MKKTYLNCIHLCGALLGFSAVALAGAGLQTYSPEPPPRPVLLLDYYHHSKPQTEVGNFLKTGGWATNVGRYGYNDFGHSNTLDGLFTLLEEDYALHTLEEPFSEKVLEQADIAFIFGPDSPDLVPGAEAISDQEIENLTAFVESGGSLILMINSGGHSTEKFEEKQLGKLFEIFGLRWNDDDTKYSDIFLEPGHHAFYDQPVAHYGAGCTFDILDHARDPKILLEVYEDEGYPGHEVRGPGIVQVKYGAGKVIAVGDTGSWGVGNLARPWAENERFLKQLFWHARPDQGLRPATYRKGQSLNYRAEIANLVVIPAKNSLNEKIEQPHTRLYQPREKTKIPYLETTADLQLNCVEVSPDGDAHWTLDLKDFRRFEKPLDTGASETPDAQWKTSPLGEMVHAQFSSNPAQWIGPDLEALFAFIPFEGARVGDRWNKEYPLRIVPVQATDLPPNRVLDTEVTYLRDETYQDRPCRVFRTSYYDWLENSGITAEDLLPEEYVKKLGGPDHRFFLPRGGKLLVQIDQWIDRKSGVVRKVRLQTNLTAWIEDTTEPDYVSNGDIDNNMVTVLSHIAKYRLQP